MLCESVSVRDEASVQRRCIVVLGMHRSATSAWTRLFALQGASLPATLAGPAHDNPRGFWESRAIADFNDDVLQAMGIDWQTPMTQPVETLCGGVVERFHDDALRLLQDEFGDAAVFALKDPRMCRLWPLWGKAMASLGVTPTFVHPLRHPLEVAASLSKRNGMSDEASQLLWLEHLLAAERASRGALRAFVTYDQLLTDWAGASRRVIEQLHLPWEGTTSSIRKEAQRFVAKTLRHHQEQDSDLAGCSPWVAAAYRACLVAATDSRDVDYATLDEVGAAYAEAATHFVPLVLQSHQKANRAERQLEEARETLDARERALHDEIGALRAAGEALRDSDAVRRATIEKIEATHRARDAAHVAELERLRSAQDARDAAQAAEVNHLRAAQQAQEAAHAADIERVTLAHRAQEETHATEIARIEAAHRDIVEAHQALELELSQRCMDLEGRLAEAAARGSNLERRLLEAYRDRDSSLRSLTQEQAKLTDRLGQLQRERESLAHSLAQERDLAAAARRTAREQRNALLKLEARMAALATVLRSEPNGLIALLQRLGVSGPAQARAMLSRHGDTGLTPDQAAAVAALSFEEGVDPERYREMHSDVAQAGVNPLLHYVQFGRGEQRAPPFAG
jgi:hypothetical protein